MTPKVLVANRGEIACRIMRTVRAMGWKSVALYTEADRDAPHVWLADEALCIGEPRAYLDISSVVDAGVRTGASLVHPGYGFLSQNATFVQACEKAGLVFVGPSASAMCALGDKRSSRDTAVACGVSVVPGASVCNTWQDAREAAQKTGYPVLLKAAGGGGGKGMRRVDEASGMQEAFVSAQREAQNAFGDSRMLLEKYVYPARHVEVQVLGNGKEAIALGERECSLQRRYQKIIEESPSAGISPEVRAVLLESATRLCASVGYANAGTVEFLVGPQNDVYFLEVNTRLQVEHPVTEMTTGMDIVQEQLLLAQGGPLPEVPSSRGWAIEARINAEHTEAGFLPSVGTLSHVSWPHAPGVRVDTGVCEGSEVSPHYDPMLAKVIAHGATREQARTRLWAALHECTVLGVHTNLSFVCRLLDSTLFKEARTYTTSVEENTWPTPVLQTSEQAYVDAVLAHIHTLGTGPSGVHAQHAGADPFSPWLPSSQNKVG